MDEQQQLRQLLDDDIRSLSAYYQEMSAEQGPGVLVVNYYPSGEIAQMEAKFLKSSQISRLARQMGLATLQIEFERHSLQTQMVVAVVTAESKGAVTVEVQPSESQSQSTPESVAEPETTPKPATKRKTTSKTSKPATRRKTTSNPEPTVEPEPTPESVAEPETTPKPTTKRKTTSKTSKPATRRKSQSKD